jgi:hypothetical protein
VLPFSQFADEVERSVHEVNKMLGPMRHSAPSASGAKPSKAVTLRTLLGVEARNLNPETEMRRLFGSRVVAAEQRQRRGGGGRARGVAVVRASHHVIVQKQNWPNPGKQGEKYVLLSSLQPHDHTFFHPRSFDGVP